MPWIVPYHLCTVGRVDAGNRVLRTQSPCYFVHKAALMFAQSSVHEFRYRWHASQHVVTDSSCCWPLGSQNLRLLGFTEHLVQRHLCGSCLVGVSSVRSTVRIRIRLDLRGLQGLLKELSILEVARTGRVAQPRDSGINTKLLEKSRGKQVMI